VNPIETLKFLGVREKFIFNSTKIPYADSIKQIEKLASFETPYDMVSCLSLMYASLKSEVVDYHKGKFELESMDDVVPLSIYCVAMATITNI